MNGRFAYFDCFSGASGDMILGALVDAGLSVEALGEDISGLPCETIHVRAEKVMRGGMRATKVHIDPEKPTSAGLPHRGLAEVREIILGSRLSESARERAIQVFTRLAEAEATVHGVSADKVHFHEVGALDSIADIVGAVAGLERLGVDRLLFSTLRLGGGPVKAAHGELPVPAPATAGLVSGLRCEMGPVEMELLTPTAAAILATLGEQAPPPPFQLQAVGYGAGTRDDPHHPNVLRIILGITAQADEADTAWLLEANLDDSTPEVCGHAIDRLLAAGALDAYVIPIQMKKSRPGLMLCAIAPDGQAAQLEQIFFRETTTLGVRRHRVERSKLRREIREVETPYGKVRVKVGLSGDKTLTISPEFEDCRRIAIEQNLPLREVIELARREYWNRSGKK